MKRTSELRALVSLLADDDERIAAMVWENLQKLGEEAWPALREASEDADPRLRSRARLALDRLSFERVQSDLRRAASGPEAAFDLEAALVAVARLEEAGASGEQVGRALDDLAARIRPRLAHRHHPLDRVGSINSVLFGEQRFALVLRSQAELRHFCLPAVLAGRAGAPALLASVYLLLADRVDLPLGVVWLPSHDLLRLEAGGQEVFVDPARSGRILSRRECVQTCLRDYQPKDSYIAEVGRRDLVVRAVRGMMLLCARTRDRARAERLGRVLEILEARERNR